MTLVEVVVAITVFCLCVGGLCRLAVMSGVISDQARNHYVAVNIAKNRVEEIRKAGMNIAESFAESTTRVDDSGNASPNGNFRRTTTFSALAGGRADVTVTVEILNRRTLSFQGEQEALRVRLSDFEMLPR